MANPILGRSEASQKNMTFFCFVVHNMPISVIVLFCAICAPLDLSLSAQSILCGSKDVPASFSFTRPCLTTYTGICARALSPHKTNASQRSKPALSSQYLELYSIEMALPLRSRLLIWLLLFCSIFPFVYLPFFHATPLLLQLCNFGSDMLDCGPLARNYALRRSRRQEKKTPANL